MDRRDAFDHYGRRGPAGDRDKRREPGLFESVEEAVFERSAVPVKDALPRSIEFQRRTESWFSFPYHCLMNLEYQPHSRIILGFSTHRVEIKGRNLESTYNVLQAQSCGQLRETDRTSSLAGAEQSPEIQAIEIYELEWGEVVSESAHRP